VVAGKLGVDCNVPPPIHLMVMFGPVTNEKNRGLPDISKREFWTLAPVIFFIVWIGIYPNTFLRKIDVTVTELLARAQARTISMRTPAPDVIPVVAENEK